MDFNETNFLNSIFLANVHNFEELALQLFQHQHRNCKVYHQYCNYLNINPNNVTTLSNIPFLPVSFFKTHDVTTGVYEPQEIFYSSATSGSIRSKHFVKDISIYERSFLTAFELEYGNPNKYAVLCLLPSYLERNGSSLVSMAQKLIEKSEHPQSGFYLYNHAELFEHLTQLLTKKTHILLLGVTFALLDFAAKFPSDLKNTIVMETGGMKGKRKEMIRTEVHQLLQQQFQVDHVHSEYGMTELLSQAYSKKNGRFKSPSWMHVVITDSTDTLQPIEIGKTGVVNIIDLANVHSCAFIQTQDIGKVNTDGTFEIAGRLDQSDMRGCSLLYL